MIRALFVLALFASCHEKHPKTPGMIVRSVLKSVKVAFLVDEKLPPSTNVLPGPPGEQCKQPGQKWPVTSAWANDPGWKALDFSYDEPLFVSLQWKRISDTEGSVTATADFDCDGKVIVWEAKVRVENGEIKSELIEPTINED